MLLQHLALGFALSFEIIGATDSGSCSQPPLPTPEEPLLISKWDILPTSKAGKDLAALSCSGVDTSAWHNVNASRCTLMGCLLQAGVYNETQLFFSDNLNHVDHGQFLVPWLYRTEFPLSPAPGRHFFVQNNGITSKADLFINGQQIATKAVQAGAYAGHTYDVTNFAAEENTLLIQVYPTDYNYDFALGFVDWNPYPPDNGSGVWRDVFVKQTGPVSLGPLRITTDYDPAAVNTSVSVTLKATAQNLENKEVTAIFQSIVSDPAGSNPLKKTVSIPIGPLESVDISLTSVIDKPAIWWPKSWGDQPLYKAELSVLDSKNSLSDTAVKSFGIRKVTSIVNSHNDTLFSVNGRPFQVVGGGYSADMFLRWDSARFTTQVQYVLDMGHNTVRLEGKNEHPEFFEIADRLGLMVMAGWECCDKWEAWTYNEDLSVKINWTQSDYEIANASMWHEAAMLQTHPSILAYLVGSDYWPDDKATELYLKALKDLDWQTPIIASAAKLSYPKALGPSGLKMPGPYDWTPPNYWYDISSTEDHLGAAFGFGSELGAGVGTPEISSLKKFLTQQDMDDLWKQPGKDLFHMSTNVSSFYNRKIYNDALWNRLGAPASLDDYLLKAQILDYEATRAQFEAYSAYWNAEQPATGLIYWMLNNAWPSLHWNLFDYYLHPAGSYFGTKTGSRVEHVAYDYIQKDLYLINHSLDRQGPRTVAIEAIGLDGKVITSNTVHTRTEPNRSKSICKLPPLTYSSDVIFLRLILSDDKKATLSRNVYWLAETIDTLDWANSDWYFTPVTKYADFKALDKLQPANVTADFSKSASGPSQVTLENHSSVPAFFISLNLVDGAGEDVLPVFWSDNYVTLWPHEKLQLQVRSDGGKDYQAIQVRGKNVASKLIPLAA